MGASDAGDGDVVALYSCEIGGTVEKGSESAAGVGVEERRSCGVGVDLAVSAAEDL